MDCNTDLFSLVGVYVVAQYIDLLLRVKLLLWLNGEDTNYN